MPTPRLSDAQRRKMAAFMSAATLEFPRRFRPNGCIAAARLALDVFGRLHVPARPLSVVVQVFNPGLVARGTREGGRVPLDQDEYDRWQREDGAWWLTLGEGDPEPGQWAGHVVAVAWGSVMIDLTLPQANRPRRGIVLPPLAAEVGPEFLGGRENRVLAVNGCELHYQARLGDTTYTAARDWHDRSRTREAVRAVLRRVLDDLRRPGGRPPLGRAAS